MAAVHPAAAGPLNIISNLTAFLLAVLQDGSLRRRIEISSSAGTA